MLNHITTPDGNLLGRHLIQIISHIPNRGVTIKDGYGRMLAYIKLEDDTQAQKVRTLLNEVVLKGKTAKQPDWSFLTAAPIVDKAAK
jgi:hypothetical protein